MDTFNAAYDCRCEDDKIIFISNNINIKQAIWSWADGRVYPERYGRPTGTNRGDLTTWEFTFTFEQARFLIRDLKTVDGTDLDSKMSALVRTALYNALPEDER